MPKSPIMLGQRHPRYLLALVALLFTAYWFFFSGPPPAVTYTHNSDLKQRLEREERKYLDMIPQRHALIQKFGPTPSQLVMYVLPVSPHATSHLVA